MKVRKQDYEWGWRQVVELVKKKTAKQFQQFFLLFELFSADIFAKFLLYNFYKKKTTK